MKGRQVSLRTRLLQYLAEHPGAELTRQEIIHQFHVGKKHVDKTLQEMRTDGVIETVHVTRIPKQPCAERPE
jgi:DNA-binding IscR family transcriptional regulator